MEERMGPAQKRSSTGIVLVPGAWFAPEAWGAVAERLRADGHPVSVTHLTGSSLADDTNQVLESITTLGGPPPVLCGHSYSGAVITGLPSERVAHLVFLAAVMPTEEETVLGLAGSEPSGMLEAARPAEGRPGYTVLDPAAAAEMLFTQSSPGEAAAHAAALVAQNMAPGDQAPQRVAWREVPSTYIVCEQDRTLSPILQRRLAGRATVTESWDSDHTPFLRVPAEVARLLAGIATQIDDQATRA
jgi:pimeloyl-ACP methyl ester carboxylesterase